MEENTIPPAPDFQEFFRSHKRTIIIVGFLLFVAYIGLNVYVWGISRKIAKQPVQTGDTTAIVASNNDTQGPLEQSAFIRDIPIITPIPTFTPTPTPRPTGPGPHACSPVGSCKLYADDVRKEKCSQTYEDNLCLDQCADPTKQCKD